MSAGRYPIACGALGRYDRRRVERVAGLLAEGLSTVHEDGESILVLDRGPLSWRHRDERGLAWSEGISRPSRIASWRDAAQRLNACGLVVERHRSYLHSSVAGIAPIYYLSDGGATYFATRIDPLVQASPEKLTIDWQAWAEIFLLSSPIGDRTPFLEVRRLPPFSVLEHRTSQGARRTVHPWPWAQDGHQAARGGGAEAVVESLREAIGSLPGGPVTCPLSGGWDSRLLLSLLRERDDLEISALTLQRQAAHPEEEYARAVASSLSVPHDEIGERPDRYWEEAAEVARRTDFQTTHHAWFMPLAGGLSRGRGPAIDGLAGDTLLKGGGVALREEQLDAPTWERSISMLWRRASAADRTRDVISDRLAAAFTSLAWGQWRSEAEPVAHHPSYLFLIQYLSRTMRAISLAPVAVLGPEVRVITPFTDDRVAQAANAVPMRPKMRQELYRQILALVNPAVASLPSTYDPDSPSKRPALERPSLAEDYRRYLESSPLRAEINTELVAQGEALDGVLTSTWSRKPFHVVQAITIMGMWQERYRDKLREIDVGDVLG